MNPILKRFSVAFALVVSVLVSCADDKGKQQENESQKNGLSKTAVVFYSQNGATRKLAHEFSRQLNAPLLELEMLKPYPSTYDSTIAAVRAERDAKKYPILKQAKLNLDAYDTVYLGYPVMFGTFAPPVYTFLDSNDLSKKVIVPFCTYGSGGRKASASEISELKPDSKVLISYGISNKRINDASVDMAGEVSAFIADVRMDKTEERLCGGYSDARALANEDSSVFEMATKDYAYLNLQPLDVSTQVVAGVNYMFHCSMKAFGGDLKTVNVKIFKPLPGRGKPQLISVEN